MWSRSTLQASALARRLRFETLPAVDGVHTSIPGELGAPRTMHIEQEHHALLLHHKIHNRSRLRHSSKCSSTKQCSHKETFSSCHKVEPVSSKCMQTWDLGIQGGYGTLAETERIESEDRVKCMCSNGGVGAPFPIIFNHGVTSRSPEHATHHV